MQPAYNIIHVELLSPAAVLAVIVEHGIGHTVRFGLVSGKDCSKTRLGLFHYKHGTVRHLVHEDGGFIQSLLPLHHRVTVGSGNGQDRDTHINIPDKFYLVHSISFYPCKINKHSPYLIIKIFRKNIVLYDFMIKFAPLKFLAGILA